MNSPERKYFDAIIDPLLDRYQRLPEKFITRNYLFNDLSVKIVFSANSDVSCLTKAIDHLRSDLKRKDALTIFCNDSIEGEFTLPFFPWADRISSEKKEIPYYKKDGIFMSKSPESNVLSFLDKDNGTGVYWITDFSKLPQYERAAPFRTIFQWWFGSFGCEMVHAAAVGMGPHGVLMPGGGGLGKSTNSVNCLESGMDFYGDDYVLLCKNGKYNIISLYNTAKLDSNSMKFFPFLQSSEKDNHRGQADKSVIFLNEYFGERIKNYTDLKCIIVPEISNKSESKIEEISASECFKKMAPSTIFQHIGSTKKIFKFIYELTNNVPCYKVLSGTDLKSTAKRVKEFVELK
ncbi:MAG: hypothetical protein ABFR75_06900 [Acidobacteriota bacterium]